MADRRDARAGDRRDGRAALRSGPGRVLTLFYGVLALAATGRSAFQLATMFHNAPTAYVLSAVAAVVYVVALVAIVRDHRLVAIVACSVEFAGVVAVGTWSVVSPHEFPDATVWSDYGSGYGGLPLVLPVLALLWLRRNRAHPGGGSGSTGPGSIGSGPG